MYNGIKKIEDVIDYIESHITEELDCDMLASKMQLSVYEFRRIFSFMVGIPLSEYIRKRRLSLAAVELMTADKTDILKISEKYGYSNQSSFTRAFMEQHGISPSACKASRSSVKLFTCQRFSVSFSGGEDVSFKIVNDEEFFIKGYTGVSTVSDSCCCENVWNGFYESGADKKLCTEKLYVSYNNDGNNVNCCIGEKSNDGQKIPATKWACFTVNTVDDEYINEIYGKIIYEWLPSANLRRNSSIPTIEVYPYDMSEDGFEWEIRIPVEQ